LLDGADPSRILQRSQEHVLIPTYEYETLCRGAHGCPYIGERINVIFACSATLLPSTYQPPPALLDAAAAADDDDDDVVVVAAVTAAADDDDDDDDRDDNNHNYTFFVDHIRLFFGGGDGNVGTAVVRIESSSSSTPPPAPAPTPPPQSSPTVPTVQLNDGRHMPRLAVSLPSDAAGAVQAVQAAFESGVTHFVTARDYLNQLEVGAALRASGRPRNE
jgi:hypothetical protein